MRIKFNVENNYFTFRKPLKFKINKFEEDEEEEQKEPQIPESLEEKLKTIQIDEVKKEQIKISPKPYYIEEIIISDDENHEKIKLKPNCVEQIASSDCENEVLIIQSISIKECDVDSVTEEKQEVFAELTKGGCETVQKSNQLISSFGPKLREPKSKCVKQQSLKPPNAEIEKLISKLKCSVIKASDRDRPIMMASLKIHEWPKAKNIKVKLMCVDQEPNVITFIEDKNYIHDFYEYMDKEIQRYAKSVRARYNLYEPRKREIILGRYDGNWHRAKVLDSKMHGVIVQFLDYGNLEILQFHDIMPITEKLTFEVCTRDFIVDSKF